MVVEGLAAVGAHPDGWQHFRNYFAVEGAPIIRGDPLEIISLFFHFDFSLFPCLNLVHGPPRPSNGGRGIINLRHPPDVLDPSLEAADEFRVLLHYEVTDDIRPDERRGPALLRPDLAVKTDVRGRVRRLCEFMVERYGFRRRALIGRDYLDIPQGLSLSAHDKVAHGGSPDILHLLEP